MNKTISTDQNKTATIYEEAAAFPESPDQSMADASPNLCQIPQTGNDYLYRKQEGSLVIPMTNDYLFRALMQLY